MESKEESLARILRRVEGGEKLADVLKDEHVNERTYFRWVL